MSRKIDVCLSPLMFDIVRNGNTNITVVIDILRATTSICTALAHGVKEVIPVASLDKARELQKQGYAVAAERDGNLLEFAEYGNSPFTFMQPHIRGKTIVYCTTNGTTGIEMVRGEGITVLGGYCNYSVLLEWLLAQQGNIIMFCAGWKGQFSLEDAVFAGLLSMNLMERQDLIPQSDAVFAAIDLFKSSGNDLLNYHEKALHNHRLIKLGYEKDIEYAFRYDTAPVIPLLEDARLRDILQKR